MDFMQCINFKSRLDREREMIRRKIRSSTLYRKPTFSKSSGMSIYNAHGDVNRVSCIAKNIKINEFRDDIRKIKSPLLVGDENDEDTLNDDKIGLSCIGSKYLDISSNLLTSKSFSSPALSLVNNEILIGKPNEMEFEKTISQSHLSPSSPSPNIYLKHQAMNENVQENLIKPNSARVLNIYEPLLSNNDNESDIESQDVPSPTLFERKDHNKLIKKSTHSFYAVGLSNTLSSKYGDALMTNVAIDELANGITSNQNKTQSNTVISAPKIKKNCVSSRKKTSKRNSPKATATRKLEPQSISH